MNVSPNWKSTWVKACKVFAKRELSVEVYEIASGFIEINLCKRNQRKQVGTLILGPSSSELYTQPHRRLRSSVTENVPTILVSSLAIDDTFRGQGLSKVLLIFGLCYFKFRHPHFQYSVLDDTSNHASQVTGNVYNQVGYEFVEPTQLSDTEPGHLRLSDPCKSLKLDQAFLEKANRNHLLEAL